MTRTDDQWIEDILTAIADIRADTAGLDATSFATRPTTIRSVLYSIAVISHHQEIDRPATATLAPIPQPEATLAQPTQPRNNSPSLRIDSNLALKPGNITNPRPKPLHILLIAASALRIKFDKDFVFSFCSTSLCPIG